MLKRLTDDIVSEVTQVLFCNVSQRPSRWMEFSRDRSCRIQRDLELGGLSVQC